MAVELPEGRRGGEVQFVPRRLPGGGRGGEGDGYILMLAFVPTAGEGEGGGAAEGAAAGGAAGIGQSELLVYDALAAAGAAPLAVVALGQRVPYGFHALWVDEEKYRGQQEVQGADAQARL